MYSQVTPLISIIIPVYKSENYIKKCVNSIISQTYANLEIILINDGSPDNCANICDEYANKDSRIKVIHQTNQGVSAARNHGIDIARGEYIGFVDSDDYIEPDMYETLLNMMLDTDSDVGCISFINYSTDGKIIPYADDNRVHVFDSQEAIKNMFDSNETTSGHLCNKLFKSYLFDNLRLNTSIKVREDALIMWDLFYKSKRIAFKKVHKYHYVYYPSSAVHSFSDSTYTSRLACLELLEKTNSYFPEISPYAKKYLIFADAEIMLFMIRCRCVDRKMYKVLKKEISNNLSEDVKQISKSFAIAMKLLSINKYLYCFIRWVYVNVFKRIKNRL